MHALRNIALLLLASGLALAPQARASGISRCTGSDGATVYTDGSCAALGAQAAAMPATLLRTLAREAGESMSPLANGASLQLGELRPVDGAAQGNRPRSYAGCPRNAQQLEAAFQESVATGDVNELAAIYDWTDVSGRQSRELLRRLERISRTRTQDVSIAANGYRRRAGCLLLAL
jgi:hypothetical protein